MRGVFLSKGCSHDPKAELLAFQSSFAVEDQWFEEIRQRLVEQTKVCTPRHVAYDVDSGLPHLGCHSGYIFGFRARRLHHTRGITAFYFALRFDCAELITFSTLGSAFAIRYHSRP